MRLLEREPNGELRLTNDLAPGAVPPYAILSHTWGPDSEEVTYQDFLDDTGKEKTGYNKIRFCAEQASRDGIQYSWVDTCCINKWNNSELQEAIISMFRWYHQAAKCYVYLSDLSITDHGRDTDPSERLWEPAFRASKWFTRGWTLQELLAPASVEFFTRDGQRLGDKESLMRLIHDITGIAVPALWGASLSEFTVDERFEWARRRQTKKPEDLAYCLLGIFGVDMNLRYGEGGEYAMRRLRKKIDKAHNCEQKSGRPGGT